MKAKDVMTAGVVTVAEDASINEAIRLMLQRKISGLPVVDAAGTLVGMVTEGDFLRRSELGTARHTPRWIEFLSGSGKLAENYVHAAGRKVRDVMTDKVYSVDEETPLSEVVEIMERRRVKRLPVLRGAKLVGIVTRANLLHALAGLQQANAPASSDITIRTRLMAELEKQSWAPLVAIDIVVTDGVVKLTGAIFDERQRHALRVAAENIPGVKHVEDRLVWIEPMSGMVIEAPSVH
jgi:CBS domain-containing protein